MGEREEQAIDALVASALDNKTSSSTTGRSSRWAATPRSSRAAACTPTCSHSRPGPTA